MIKAIKIVDNVNILTFEPRLNNMIPQSVTFEYCDGSAEEFSYDDLSVLIENRYTLHKALSDAETKIQELETQLAFKSSTIHVMFGVAILTAIVVMLIFVWGAI